MGAGGWRGWQGGIFFLGGIPMRMASASDVMACLYGSWSGTILSNLGLLICVTLFLSAPLGFSDPI